MRILMVHRYFWPDVSTYAQMLRYIGSHLAGDGHEVSVFCGPPTYNDVYSGPAHPRRETVDGIRVQRVSLPPDSKSRPAIRALSLLIFAIRLVGHALRGRRSIDLITVTTIPPVVMGAAARAVRRLTGIPYVYHCMDLYPEVAEISGLSRRRLLLRAARHLDTGNCRRALAVIVLSEDMRATLLERGLRGANIVVQNNFEIVTDTTLAPYEEAASVQAKRFRIVFAGNMGRFQGLKTLMDAACEVAQARIGVEFLFMGAGAMVPALRQQAGSLLGQQIRFLDHQPVDVAAQVLRESALAVVSLAPGISRVAYPSKTMTYLAAGCRILAVIEPGSELARLITDEGLGSVCPPGGREGIVHAILSEVDQGAASRSDRMRVASVGAKRFGRAATLENWTRLMADLGGRIG